MSSNEVTTHQVQGVCEVMQMRGDWVEYHVEIGRQFPVKLSTKQPAVKDAAQAAVNAKAQAVWTYSERQGNPNPHRPGEFFKKRYLESVVIGGTLDPALAEQQQTHQDEAAGAPQTRTFSTDERGVSIERQVIVKALAPLFALADADEERLFALADRLDDWMGRVRAKPPEEPTEKNEPVNDGQRQDETDDIPF